MTRAILISLGFLSLYCCSLPCAVGSEGRAADSQVAEEPADFTQQIRPILAANCFACHGRDEAARQADLRLDERQAAIDYGAIVPDDSGSSLLVERITADDPALRMPPSDSGHRLTDDEIRLLVRWIDEGAEYSGHWSFVPPQRPTPPAVELTEWPTGAIDRFILRQLEDAGLAPAAMADPHVLVRRLFLDLTGLPPTPETADEFAANPSLEAYEKLVDGLLASPRFGEHWARTWLDLARYADTKGYEKDFPRDAWPFRDWVIRALNEDMPYDQFTIEQLAGDLLPGRSHEQLIATAFHRNTMTNDEGGTDDEEFRVAAVKDRVDTTMQVWMGLTAGCAKCHSHKYDPISHEEYYRLFAVFNQTADADRFDEAPVMWLETPQQRERLKELRTRIAALKNERKASDHQAEAPPHGLAAAGQGGSDGVPLGDEEPADEQSDEETKLPKLEEELNQLEAEVTKLPIMEELAAEKSRTTHIHRRGNFLDPGEEVSPGVPSAFRELAEDMPHDRLALARWLVADENPLAARVAANRIWARLFGAGLVTTEGDFGLQGAPPSHPRLLDWLATQYRDVHAWSLKKLCKTIVMSATYRQSSISDDAKRAADPQNRLLSRGPRFRLPAETVRDQALAASGLLSRKMFGPPVMPPQPPGVWKSIYNARKWETSAGEDRYRRAIYTYWKRTSPYPAMTIFDAESREVSCIRRLPTNTPLQALVLMNDPVYLEAAAALAERMIREGGDAPAERIARGFRLLLVRPPTVSELERLETLRDAANEKLRANPEDAREFLSSCHADRLMSGSLTAHEFASYVVVASVLLNLDESVMRN